MSSETYTHAREKILWQRYRKSILFYILYTCRNTAIAVTRSNKHVYTWTGPLLSIHSKAYTFGSLYSMVHYSIVSDTTPLKDVSQKCCIRTNTVFTPSKYSDTSTPYHTCSKNWTSTIYYQMLCLKIAGWVADEIPNSAASHLGLHCLLRPVCPNTYSKYSMYRLYRKVKCIYGHFPTQSIHIISIFICSSVGV